MEKAIEKEREEKKGDEGGKTMEKTSKGERGKEKGRL